MYLNASRAVCVFNVPLKASWPDRRPEVDPARMPEGVD